LAVILENFILGTFENWIAGDHYFIELY